jgi:hypothetical protein
VRFWEVPAKANNTLLFLGFFYNFKIMVTVSLAVNLLQQPRHASLFDWRGDGTEQAERYSLKIGLQ